MATYSIKVLKDGRTLTRKQISKGLIKTEAVVIKAGADQAYVFSDALLENKAPAKIQTRRVGQNLHVALGDSSVAAPDLIIEGYFDFAPAPMLGTLSDGSIAAYDMNQIMGLAQSSAVPAGAETLASSTAAASGLADPTPYAGLTGLQLGGAIGLGALALAGAAGSGGKGSDPTAAQTAQSKIDSFAGDGTQAAPGLADYAALGVAGVTASNLLAINSAVDALSASDVNSVAKVQSIVDAYNKILTEANGATADATPGNNPSAVQYSAVGANIGEAATDPENLSLLNDVIGNKSGADVDTIAEINALAAAVNAVMTGAAGSAAPSLAQLALLDITGVTADNLALVQAAIADTLDSGTAVDTVVELQAVVNAAVSLAVLGNYASSNTNVLPTLTDYSQSNVTGVTGANLHAINSAIDALGATDVNTIAKVQAVVDAYNKILAEANGAAADATPATNPTALDYAALGASLGAAASNAVNLALLNDVVGSKTSTDVDTVAEINALAVAANAVMTGAAGGAAPSMAQLSVLGMTGVTADNLAVVQAGIAASIDSGTGVDTVAELQAIVNTAISLTAIGNYAASNVNAAPTLADYSQLGVAGVTSGNLLAVNSAVDALGQADVGSAAKVQTVVDAYNKILAEANGAAADASPSANPFASDYAAIGASIGLAATNSYALSLLDDIVGGLTTSAVDTVSEINRLAQVVDKLMNTAVGTASTLTVADFNTIGIATAGAGAVTGVNLGAVTDAIASAGGQNHIDTLAELQTLVTAVASIVSYADDSSQAAPTLGTYTNAGLSGVTAANLAAINSGIDANAATGVHTKLEMQGLIDAYTVILAEANGSAADATPTVNPTAAQYAAIGANIGAAATDAESLGLLNDVVANLNTANVDTVAEINALAATVDKIMNLAAFATGSTIPAGAPSMAELTALGLNTTLANTAAEQTAIWQAMIDSADSGTGVTTTLQLQALINAHSS